MAETAHNETPEAGEVDYLPALEAALRYFGKGMDREAMLAGLPQIGRAHV